MRKVDHRVETEMCDMRDDSGESSVETVGLIIEKIAGKFACFRLQPKACPFLCICLTFSFICTGCILMDTNKKITFIGFDICHQMTLLRSCTS